MTDALIRLSATEAVDCNAPRRSIGECQRRLPTINGRAIHPRSKPANPVRVRPGVP